MTPGQFEQALQSLEGYFGTIGVFGGNPAVHPQFEGLCELLMKYFPKEKCGLWCNNPLTPQKARAMRAAFNPAVSNLNVHLSEDAYRMFKAHWPESMPFGLTQESRHSPCYVAMKDVLHTECPDCGGHGSWLEKPDNPECPLCKGTGLVYDESKAWELISSCDINQHWSAGIGVFRGQLRAWFCEIAMAQSILHQDESDYPDTGLSPLIRYSLGGFDTGDELAWWELKMPAFAEQVRKHCHDCGVPLRGYGQLSQAEDVCPRCEGKGTIYSGGEHAPCGRCQGTGGPAEQVSAAHRAVYLPKRKDRRVELVTLPSQLGRPLETSTHYLQNSRR